MKNLNRVHLSGLRAIEAVGRHGNLRLAADELGVTPGAVSQQIQKTEQQLGRPLFDRKAKGLEPTPRGREVMRHLTAGMAELSTAVSVAEQANSDALTVSVAPVFAGKWLVWRLTDFYKEHPEIRVRVDASIALINPELSDVDVCIRVGKGGWTDVQAEALVEHRVFPVCSPAIGAKIRKIEDLAHVPIIRDEGEMFRWNTWLAPQGYDQSMLGDGPRFSDGSLCLDAAVAGQGVFLAWETLAFDALEMGRLVAPLPGCHPTGFSYWLVTGLHRRKSEKVRAFETWLRRMLAASLLFEADGARFKKEQP
ncbi:LysR family transcriptional regulator [Hoeflea sp. WL0058]|uniref:LysR family transcriptional regulator n=1 Tax=Flavimaribacter sediminis TaxID=2865987 RepID=A0AAE3D0J0_9HYPH|nr:LysR substrate-binding domain-containing protein [Flavimaribacter sediminis]MBW8638555.1 LysR family transcriptional regulator [Flavimaribacter sediminis]